MKISIKEIRKDVKRNLEICECQRNYIHPISRVKIVLIKPECNNTSVVVKTKCPTCENIRTFHKGYFLM